VNPLLLLNWRVWAAVAIAVTLAASHWKAYSAGKASIRTEWNAQLLEVANQSRKLLEKTAADTAELQAQAEKTTEAKNEQIQALNARVAAISAELRNRPQRPGGAGVPTTPADGKAASGCTGAQLYRSDSEVLTRIGRDADELRLQLKACYAQYDTARSKFETLTKKD
jgi:hypothetical protein